LCHLDTILIIFKGQGRRLKFSQGHRRKSVSEEIGANLTGSYHAVSH